MIFKSCMQDFEKGVYVILIIGMRFLIVVCVILKKGLLRWSRSRGEINLATGSATQINTTSRWVFQRHRITERIKDLTSVPFDPDKAESIDRDLTMACKSAEKNAAPPSEACAASNFTTSHWQT